jgi:hypothetical protein
MPDRWPACRGPVEGVEEGEAKMSPLPAAAAETLMSPLGGQNVTAARTQLCHPNRQGREEVEPSEPPPSSLPPPSSGPAARGAAASTGEGASEIKETEAMNGDSRIDTKNWGVAIRAVYAAWVEREALSADRRELFDRQAERLADGGDIEAWTHRQNGTVVPAEDRRRVFALGLRNLRDGTSRTLRGGVMYAVAKHIAGTEHAAVVAKGSAAVTPGSDRNRAEPAAAVTPVCVLVARPEHGGAVGENPVERWERENPEECVPLRNRVAAQLVRDAGGWQVSEAVLRMMGRAQYEQLVLGRLHREATLVAAGCA